MITGEVTPHREAIIPLTIVGSDGRETTVEAVQDTGFDDHLTLPPGMIRTLQLPYRTSTQFTLADGSVVAFGVFRATILWEGQPRVIPALAADGGILAGMALLQGSRVTLDVVDGGRVTIESLP